MGRPLSDAIRAGVLAALALLAACGDGSAALDRLSLGERGKVVSVQSGDVIALDSGLTVRLAGIETPYAGEPGADVAEADLARRVKGRTVELLYGGLRRDTRGRALAQVRLADGRGWVQGALLKDGVAMVRTWSDNRAMSPEMLEDEAKARIARRGLWGQGVFQVHLPREIDARTRDFQIVEGRVASATRAHPGTWLDFTPDHRGFAALIDRATERDLAQTKMAAASLGGRLIRIRGVIGWDGLMRIDHPEQIELLKAK